MYLCLNRATCGQNLPLEEFVNLAASAGFDGADVELAYGVEHGVAKLRDLYASRKQRFGGWGLGDWQSDEPQHRDCLEALRDQAKIASEMGIDSCMTWIMPSSDRPLRDNWKFHVDRLKPAAKILADNGLRLGLEFVSPYHLRRHYPHEFIFTPGMTLELADEIGPNCGLVVDAFHIHAAGENLEYLASLFIEKVVLVHISDCADQELPRVQDAQRVLPGEGVIDLKGFMKAVKSTGYDGAVSLEVYSHVLETQPADEIARKARDATRAAVGL